MSTEIKSALSELSRVGSEGAKNLAREASSLAEQLGAALAKLETSLKSVETLPPPQPIVPVVAPAEIQPPMEKAASMLLEFMLKSRAARYQHEIPGLLTTTAAHFAPRVFLFAKRERELVGWDCRIAGRQDLAIRGKKLSLRDLQDLAETLEEGQVFNYAGLLEPFYSQLPPDMKGPDVGSCCFIPLKIAEQCIGVLCADSPHAGRALDEIPLQVLTQQAALLMELSLRSEVKAASEAPAAGAGVAELPQAAAPASEDISVLETELEEMDRAAGSGSSSAATAVEEVPDFLVSEEKAGGAAVEEAPDFLVSEEKSGGAAVEETPDFLIQEERPATPEQASEEVPDFLVPETSATSSATVETPPKAEVAPTAEAEPEWAVEEEVSFGDDVDFGDVELESGESDFHRDNKAEPEFKLSLSNEGELNEEEKAARRLARLIVDELLLYNKAKIEKGRERGNVGEFLVDDVHKATMHYKAKVGPHLFPKRFFWNALVEKVANGRPELFKTMKPIEF